MSSSAQSFRHPSHPGASLQSTAHTHLQIRKEQVYLLYKPTLGAAIASLISASLLAFMQWQVIDHLIILLWFTAISLVTIARIISWALFFRTNPGLLKIKYWEKLSIVIMIFSAATWAAAGIYLFPEGDYARQTATVVILAGMAAGAVTTLSALRVPVFIFLPSAMLPVTLHLFFEATDMTTALGVLCVIYIFFLSTSANQNYNTHLQNITLRIKSSNEEKAVRISEATVLKTSQILQMIATGEPASNIYDAIALLYESRHPGLRCSMLILKGNKLRHGGAPSLPAAYCNALNGLENGPNVGSCGTSTFTGKRVLVEDIATDPKWAAIKDVALPHGMRCCWSEPIKSSTGKTLGAFGMYYDHPALPTDDELADLESAAQLASIIMEREQRDDLLKKLSRSLEQSGEAVAITNAEGIIEYVNSAFTKLTGYSAEEVLAHTPRVLKSGQQSDEFYTTLWKTISSGNVWAGQIIEKRKDGSVYPANLSISPVRNSGGDITHFIGTHSDLTQLNLLTEQLHQKYKMEAVGHMAGGIAHNFNNNLAIILGNLELSQLKLGDNSEVSAYLDNMKTAVYRSRDLVQQILTYSRNTGQSNTPTQLSVIVEETLGLLDSTIPSTVSLQLKKSPDSANFIINGNPSKIQEVLVNLCNNAVHAMTERGELTMTLDSAELLQKDIPAQYPRLPGRYARLSVVDTGTGMMPEIQKYIFDPFFTTKDVTEGTGMGLATVQGIMNQHDGMIKVKSTPGVGSTFELYFPLIDSQPVRENAQQRETTGGIETILLVDDDEMLIDICYRILSEYGYQVIKETNSLQALERFQENPAHFDLVISDQTMPDLTGKELLGKILAMQPEMPTILCTGHSSRINEKTALAMGIKAFCLKPLDLPELLQTVRAVLDQR